MKKIYLYLGLLTILIITGCSSKEYNINYIEDEEHSISDNYTYRFIGESEHFYLQTGKVYYDGKNRELLLSNFKVKDNTKANATYKINLYFNDKLLYGDIFGTDSLSKSSFEDIVIAEQGILEKNENGKNIGESDSFLETTEDTFKDSIKLEASYCIKNKCTKETFKIKYID